MRKTICVDLDGVLNLYDGWKGEDHWPEMRPGATEFLQALVGMGFTVTVFTTRPYHGTRAWLGDWSLNDLVLDVVDHKIPAFAYVDDRGICFTGDFDATLRDIQGFRAHWESPDEAGV